ncbi:MAG: CSLREA domain-containing protein, partial [Burkholderiales bacterium]|nr:CSLREA domain-containing protein [Burkholderiales bacterium]
MRKPWPGRRAMIRRRGVCTVRPVVPLRAFARAVLIGAWLPLLAPWASSHAATITVNGTSDAVNASDGVCTLREALVAANGNVA